MKFYVVLLNYYTCLRSLLLDRIQKYNQLVYIDPEMDAKHGRLCVTYSKQLLELNYNIKTITTVILLYCMIVFRSYRKTQAIMICDLCCYVYSVINLVH